MDDVLVERERRGPVSVLTMVYRPYNLLGPKLMGALAAELSSAREAGSRAIVLRSGSRTRHGGTYRLPGRPWHFSADLLQPSGDPAFQGEHNRTVFSELGLSDSEIERYIGTGALVSAVPASTVPINELAKA